MKHPHISRYPREIRIGDDVYKVKFVTRIGPSRKILGLCDPANHTIRIRTGQSPEETLKTFIHEILHAIEFSREVKLSHELVYQLEQCLYDVLVDNF